LGYIRKVTSELIEHQLRRCAIEADDRQLHVFSHEFHPSTTEKANGQIVAPTR
jgi:hypothetical protein